MRLSSILGPSHPTRGHLLSSFWHQITNRIWVTVILWLPFLFVLTHRWVHLVFVINSLIKGSNRSEQINKPDLYRAYQRKEKKNCCSSKPIFAFGKTNCLKCYYRSLETRCCHSQAAPLSGGAHARRRRRRRCQPPASHSASPGSVRQRGGEVGVV